MPSRRSKNYIQIAITKTCENCSLLVGQKAMVLGRRTARLVSKRQAREWKLKFARLVTCQLSRKISHMGKCTFTISAIALYIAMATLECSIKLWAETRGACRQSSLDVAKLQPRLATENAACTILTSVTTGIMPVTRIKILSLVI